MKIDENMEALSVDERCEIERRRIVKLLKENDGKLPLENLTEKYKEKYKIDLEQWKGAFVQFSTFIKYGCSGKIDIVNDRHRSQRREALTLSLVHSNIYRSHNFPNFTDSRTEISGKGYRTEFGGSKWQVQSRKGYIQMRLWRSNKAVFAGGSKK